MKRMIQMSSLLLFLLVSMEATAQKPYKAKNGLLAIKAIKNDTIATHAFKNVQVILDYERAEVDISFLLEGDSSEPKSLPGRSEAFNTKITTKLSLPKIETLPHPDQSFHTKGQIIFRGTVFELDGNGELRHHQGSETYSCSLMLKLNLLKGEALEFDQFGKVISLHLFQTVLDPNY